MRKTIITIMASTVVLSACGNDKVQQLEEKKSSLKSDNRKLKQEVLDLEDKNKTYKQKENSVKSKIKKNEQESSSQFTTQYLKSSTKFVNETKTNIASYNRIKKNVTSKFDDEHTKNELENIYHNQENITDRYKDEMKGKSIPKDYKTLHKSMLKLSTSFEKVFKDLNDAYNKKDKKDVQKAIDELHGLDKEIGQIE
ncbi:hypothetical protein MUA77_06960 [Mammaliicoccus sciuri]|uniref:hypothetical protein n=1 Tax=Mammaliicoccus sciuri TaxID=1296 RepID=UPI0021D06985|nr:hypothetical protein [Mammaliicoccus sciuri]UXU85124.1 hypothetical protein MUA77_06960 [Mammaliicoccus sciuri]UXU94969.1 hypothetical protein MUA42_06970 [Mammaliicoccus sciuri]UXV16916.1 hypothetical protein MUA89_06965 [Mammaliicoccus sciuri]UXV25179.1 hypothetical protein MUA49_06965 [Mammaliicoccus sciuri]UXV27966.1 hypothetical protein MUA96_06965 [Mammaliicoccus sciuri]